VNWLKYLCGLLLIVLIILIGYSRVYLRVHYASDVIAGFIIGFLWLMISLFVLDRLEIYAKSQDGIAVPAAHINDCFPSIHVTRHTTGELQLRNKFLSSMCQA
jgi:hypothetical protein